jgi:O-antigen ligase
LALRRYRLLIEGAVVLVILVSAVSIFRPKSLPNFFSAVVYKNASEGVLTSRLAPWQKSLDDISDNPWFGTGLGTTADGPSDEGESRFHSSSSLTAENGSSYLALLAGAGIVGSLPSFGLLLVLIGQVIRTVLLRSSTSPLHPAIPLAMLVVAGLVHASFEDWMFAAGNYLCVFFWSLAFIFIDLAPVARVSEHAATSAQNPGQQAFARATPVP